MNKILASVLALFLSSCACALPQNRNNPGCRLLNVIIDCALSEAGTGFYDLVAAVTPYISGKMIDWNALGNLEKQNGTDMVACALQKALSIATGSSVSQDFADTPIGQLQLQRNNVFYNVHEYMAKRHIEFAPAKLTSSPHDLGIPHHAPHSSGQLDIGY